VSPTVAALLAELREDPDALAELRELLAVEPEPTLLTAADAAQRAGVHVETIRRAIRDEQLVASHARGALRIAPGDLAAWLASPRARRATGAHRAARRASTRRPLADALAGGRSSSARSTRTNRSPRAGTTSKETYR